MVDLIVTEHSVSRTVLKTKEGWIFLAVPASDLGKDPVFYEIYRRQNPHETADDAFFCKAKLGNYNLKWFQERNIIPLNDKHVAAINVLGIEGFKTTKFWEVNAGTLAGLRYSNSDFTLDDGDACMALLRHGRIEQATGIALKKAEIKKDLYPRQIVSPYTVNKKAFLCQEEEVESEEESYCDSC